MNEERTIDNNMAYVLTTRKTSFAWVTRQLALAFALVTAGVAVFALVSGELDRRDTTPSARQAEDYSGIAYYAGRQRELLLRSPGGRSEDVREAMRLTDEIEALLSRL